MRLFGYPENYEIPVKESLAFDLLGNTVVVPVIKAISERILAAFGIVKKYQDFPHLQTQEMKHFCN